MSRLGLLKLACWSCLSLFSRGFRRDYSIPPNLYPNHWFERFFLEMSKRTVSDIEHSAIAEGIRGNVSPPEEEGRKMRKIESTVESEPKKKSGNSSGRGRGRPTKKAAAEELTTAVVDQPVPAETSRASDRPRTKPLHEHIANEANTPIVDMLHDLADVNFKRGDSGKGIHYQAAAKHIREHVAEIKSGEMAHIIVTIGEYTANHIDELLKTGKVKLLEDLKREIAAREEP